MSITLDNSKPTDAFDRTARLLDDATAKLADLKARRERVVAGRDAAATAAKDAKNELAAVALKRADGEQVDGAKAKRAVIDTTSELEASESAVSIVEADVGTANVEYLQARVDHGRHDEARLRLIIVERTRALAKGGRMFGSLMVDVTKAVGDLAEAQRDNRAELYKLNPALANGQSRFVCDDSLTRVDRLTGALGGHIINMIVENRPNGIDFDAVAAREEAEARRESR